mgnify:CR=1 FL=1
MQVGKIDLDLVYETIRRYKQACSLLEAVETLLDSILDYHHIEFLFREDTFEPILDAQNDELMRFAVHRKYQKDDWFGYLIIKKDGNIVLEEEKIEEDGCEE